LPLAGLRLLPSVPLPPPVLQLRVVPAAPLPPVLRAVLRRRLLLRPVLLRLVVLRPVGAVLAAWLLDLVLVRLRLLRPPLRELRLRLPPGLLGRLLRRL